MGRGARALAVPPTDTPRLSSRPPLTIRAVSRGGGIGQGREIGHVDERERLGVDAVASAGRRRAVGEHVAEVAIAPRADDLHPQHAVAAVRFVVATFSSDDRLEEAGPPGAGVGRTSRSTRTAAAAADAGVDAVAACCRAASRRTAARCPAPEPPRNWAGDSSARHSASVFTIRGTSTGPTSCPAALNTFTETHG